MQIPVDTGNSLVQPMSPAQLHPMERMPAPGASPSPREGRTTKTFPMQPPNLPVSQKKSAAGARNFSHALEKAFPRSGMGEAHVPLSVRAVPSLSAGCAGAGASR